MANPNQKDTPKQEPKPDEGAAPDAKSPPESEVELKRAKALEAEQLRAAEAARRASVPEPPESEVELKRAKALEAEQFRAAEAARRASVLEQSKKSGEVNYKEAQEQGTRAAQSVRDRALMGREPGVYVTSPVKLMNEQGQGIECPIGMRIPNAMVRTMHADEIARLVKGGALDDLR